MKRTSPFWVAAGLLIFACIISRAEERKYTLQDLQALDKSESWNELVIHLLDVPPASRNADWNKVVQDACTRPGQYDSDVAQYCLEPLKAVLISKPDDAAFAWKAGKWARVNLASWTAVPFFDKAGLKAGDARCKDDDVTIAVAAGLDQTASEVPAVVIGSKRLGFQICWPDTRAAIMEKLNSSPGGQFMENACPDLKKKGGLSNYQAKSCHP